MRRMRNRHPGRDLFKDLHGVYILLSSCEVLPEYLTHQIKDTSTATDGQGLVYSQIVRIHGLQAGSAMSFLPVPGS